MIGPRLLPGLAAALLAVGCATVAPSPGAGPAAPDLQAAVATIRAAGQAASIELDVQPLRDPQVTDLQDRAAGHEAAGRLARAAEALDDALAISPDDPLLLQQRAEVALLAGDLDAATRFALRSEAVGPQVGPLCRRQREALVQVEQLRVQAGEVLAATHLDAARRERDACTVTPPPRY
jgi:tetratricopeptide (TPR) repeat protein